MKKTLKGVYLVLSSLFIYLLHLPFAFAKSSNNHNTRTLSRQTVATVDNSMMSESRLMHTYDSLKLNVKGLSKPAYENAVKGMQKLVERGKLRNDSIITIADFSQSSTKKRLFVIDVKNYRVLFNTWVAHGRNSGREMANSFSNVESSFKSSPGFYMTREPYLGKHGYSLRLDGLERGINDKAFARAIVMHGADYVNPSLIGLQGYIGRSLGCPAVPTREATPIINTIKNGSCMFIYNPDYIKRSPVLNS